MEEYCDNGLNFNHVIVNTTQADDGLLITVVDMNGGILVYAMYYNGNWMHRLYLNEVLGYA